MLMDQVGVEDCRWVIQDGVWNLADEGKDLLLVLTMAAVKGTVSEQVA